MNSNLLQFRKFELITTLKFELMHAPQFSQHEKIYNKISSYPMFTITRIKLKLTRSHKLNQLNYCISKQKLELN